MSINYQQAGVDISRGEEIVSNIKKMLGASGASIGHFAGAVRIPMQGAEPALLVSSIDGVGTKLSVAIAMGKYDTIGMDLVHHSVNDLMCCGAEPFAFLDYVAASKLDVENVSTVIQGIVNACTALNIQLAGGETAEMPGVYISGEMDLVGTIFGVVKESEFIDGRTVSRGDSVVGFPSTGLHTNGYSLARNILSVNNIQFQDDLANGSGRTWGEALLAVHKCYRDEIRSLKSSGRLAALAHITGGGIYSNTIRVIPKGMALEFDWDSWEMTFVFRKLMALGNVSHEEARKVFNLGIGLTAIVSGDVDDDFLREYGCIKVGKVI